MNGTQRSISNSRSATQLCAAIGAVAAAVALLAFAPAAKADTYGHTMAIGVFGGYNVASDIYNGTNSVGSSQASLELKNGFMWGGRLTKFTSDYSAAEFSYTRNGSDLNVKNFSGVLPPGFDAGKITADQYDLNFLISQPAPNPKMWPYFVLGFGWTITHPEINPPTSASAVHPEDKSLFAFNFGLGTLVEMNPKMGVRLDARWRVTDTAITTSSGVYCDFYGYCWGYSSDWYNSGEFTAGIEYKIGK
jgi:opacity protein-like surface antigen